MKRYTIASIIAFIALISFSTTYAMLQKEQIAYAPEVEKSDDSGTALATTTVLSAIQQVPKAEVVTAVSTPKKAAISNYTIIGSISTILQKIAKCESGNDPTAKNKSSSAKGLLQILDGTWQSFQCEGNAYNAADNMQCGMKIVTESGLHHWDESKSCWMPLVKGDVIADNRG